MATVHRPRGRSLVSAFLYVDLCACAGKGEGQERKGLDGSLNVNNFICGQIQSAILYARDGVRSPSSSKQLNSKDLSHARSIAVCTSRL